MGQCRWMHTCIRKPLWDAQADPLAACASVNAPYRGWNIAAPEHAGEAGQAMHQDLAR